MGSQCSIPSTNAVGNETNATNCSENVIEGLNLTNMCNRDTFDAVIMFIMYILVIAIGMISNASVILASIFERWKEIDQFTFVMAVSQAFCHFLLAFFVYPMGAYSMIYEKGWDTKAPGKLWCWQTALLSSYFEVMYVLHIMMLGADIIIGRFTKLKDNVFVALSKRVALSLWVVALVPQAYVFLANGRSDGVFGFVEGSNKDKHGRCFATYVYPCWAKFLEYLIIFIILPLTYSVVQYVVLLIRANKRDSTDAKKREERSFWMNYRTSFIMIALYAVSQFPRWIYIFITIAREEKQLKVEPSIRVADFIVLWSSFGSIFIPLGYLVTCPTYFQQVTQFTWMAWLKRFEPCIYRQRKKKPSGHERCHTESPSNLVSQSVC